MLRQPGERMKRFTIDVPESLHRRIKAECALRGVKMADFLRETLEKLSRRIGNINRKFR